MACSPPAYLDVRPFEASFLGGPVFALSDPTGAEEAVAWALDAGCRLVVCRTAVGEGEPLKAAGFRKIEQLVTYARSLEDAPPVRSTWRIEQAGETDVEACRAIAALALRSDRFHADPRIDDRVASDLKAAWIENSIRGRADSVFLAVRAGSVAGFNAVNLRGTTAIIDLIAVSPAFHGKGAASALIGAALERYSGTCVEMRVGTQAANLPALRLYEKLGFEEVGQAETWHWHPSGPASMKAKD